MIWKRVDCCRLEFKFHKLTIMPLSDEFSLHRVYLYYAKFFWEPHLLMDGLISGELQTFWKTWYSIELYRKMVAYRESFFALFLISLLVTALSGNNEFCCTSTLDVSRGKGEQVLAISSYLASYVSMDRLRRIPKVKKNWKKHKTKQTNKTEQKNVSLLFNWCSWSEFPSRNSCYRKGSYYWLLNIAAK